MARDDRVEHPVREQKFGALKIVGEFLVAGLLVTRRPANPISAPGSEKFRSPSIANDAATPPVVGSHSTEM